MPCSCKIFVSLSGWSIGNVDTRLIQNVALAADYSSCSFWKLWTFKHDTQVHKRVQPIWCFTVNVHPTSCTTKLEKEAEVEVNGAGCSYTAGSQTSIPDVAKCVPPHLQFIHLLRLQVDGVEILQGKTQWRLKKSKHLHWNWVFFVGQRRILHDT